jgi:hypothetical protein
MFKTAMLLSLFFLLAGLPATSQQKGSSFGGSASDTPNPGKIVERQRRILGVASVQGATTKFTRRFDKQSWMVLDPGPLKDLIGQTVEVTADIYTNPDGIRVLRVRTFPMPSTNPTSKMNE